MTKTATLTSAGAAQELEEAERLHADLRARIASGDASVTPGEVTEAAGRVELARLRAEAASDHDAYRAEQRRVDRIEEIRERLGSGALRAKAADVLELRDLAVATLRELHQLASEQQEELRAAAQELRQLGPLPPSVDVQRLSTGASRLYVDGVTWDAGSDLADHLVAEAARAVVRLPRAMATVAGSSRPNAASEALRRSVETEPDTQALPPTAVVTVQYLEGQGSRVAGQHARMRWSQARPLVEQGTAQVLPRS